MQQLHLCQVLCAAALLTFGCDVSCGEIRSPETLTGAHYCKR